MEKDVRHMLRDENEVGYFEPQKEKKKANPS
jgi:hypothetical protein